MPGPAALSPGQHLPGGRQQALLVEEETGSRHVVEAEERSTQTPGSFLREQGHLCAEEDQPDMNGDLVLKTSLEPGATTQGLFTSHLAT